MNSDSTQFIKIQLLEQGEMTVNPLSLFSSVLYDWAVVCPVIMTTTTTESPVLSLSLSVRYAPRGPLLFCLVHLSISY